MPRAATFLAATLLKVRFARLAQVGSETARIGDMPGKAR